MSRRRTVYPTDEIARLWISGRVPEARNPTGNFYFQGDDIYSYGSHFLIATIVRRGDKRAVLFTTRSYSVTTRGHIASVRSAIRGVPVFFTSRPERPPTHAEMFKQYGEWIQDAIKDICQVRLWRQHPSLEDKYAHLNELIETIGEYADFYGLKRTYMQIDSREVSYNRWTAPLAIIDVVSPSPVVADPGNGFQSITLHGRNFSKGANVFVWSHAQPVDQTIWNWEMKFQVPAENVIRTSRHQLIVSLQFGDKAGKWSVMVRNLHFEKSESISFHVIRRDVYVTGRGHRVVRPFLHRLAPAKPSSDGE